MNPQSLKITNGHPSKSLSGQKPHLILYIMVIVDNDLFPMLQIHRGRRALENLTIVELQCFLMEIAAI